MTRDNATHKMTSSHSVVTALALLTASLVAPAAVARAQQALPRLADTMYDKELPPVIAPMPWPILCPPLPPGRTVQPPGREGRLECAEHYETIAEEVFRTYATSSDGEVRTRCAEVLRQLWLAGRLRGHIKALIIERDIVPVLAQIPLPDGRLELRVSTRSSFSFPPITFSVRSALYRNGVALWPPRQGLGRTSLQNELQLASMGTGRYEAGDVYAFDIVIDEESGSDIVWRKVLRTNAVTVQ